MRISDWSSDVCSSDLLGALEQGGVPEVRRGGLDRLDDVAEHGEVDRDLLGVAPTGDEARFLVERGIDDVRHAGEVGRMSAAGRRIDQIVAQEPSRRPSYPPDPGTGKSSCRAQVGQ